MQVAEKRSAAELMYTWTFPGAPVRIRFSIDVVQQISQDIVHTYSVGAADRELWGILLGQHDSRGTIEILEQKSLGFWPNDAESIEARRSRFAQACAEWRAGNGDLCAIGCYRTACEHLIQLRDDDLALIQECFVQPHNVFLVIDNPADSGTSPKAGFFFYDLGRIHSAFSFMEFPFDAGQLSVLAAQQQSTMPPDAGTRNPEIDPPSYTLIEETLPRSDRRQAIGAFVKYTGVALGLAILVVSAAMWLHHLPASYGVRGEHAKPVTTATGVRFAKSQPQPVVKPAPSVADARSKVPLPAKQAVPIKGMPDLGRQHPRAVLNTIHSSGAGVKSNSGPLARAVSTSREVSKPPLPTTVSSRPDTLTGQGATIEPPRYSPAKPLERVDPIIPAELRHAISDVISVLLRIRIDANGQVTDVRPVSTDRSKTEFTNFAMSAARNWTFEPARYGNRAVASEAVLEFRFVPEMR